MSKQKLMPAAERVDAAEKLRPQFLIIGAQKCGTTALFEYLCAHPQVVPPSAKEINFFLCTSRYARGLKFYHSFFADRAAADNDQLTFEASPNYMAGWDAPQRIYDYDRRMKLIALLRDPVDRAYSAWQMYQRFYAKSRNWYFDWMTECDCSIDVHGYERRLESFGGDFRNDVVQEIEARAAGRPIEAPFLRHGLYAEQLAAFARYFSRDQLLVLESRQFKQNTRPVLQTVEEFLGLRHHAWPDVDIQPVFVGGYQENIPADAESALKEFYRDSNQKLFEFLGQAYDWK